MSCPECERLRSFAMGQNMVIESLQASLERSNHLVETLSKALKHELKGEEKTMIHD